MPSDAGRAFLVGVACVCVAQLRPPTPNCGFCGFKVRVSLLLRKRGFAEARPWGIASARYTKTYKEPTSTKCSVGLLSGGPRAPAPAANTAGMARDAYACYLRRNLACRRPIQFIRTDYKRGRGMRAHPSPSIHNNAQSSHALRPHTPTSCGRPPPLRPPASRRADGLTAPHAPPSAPPAAPKRPSTVRIKRASPSGFSTAPRSACLSS